VAQRAGVVKRSVKQTMEIYFSEKFKTLRKTRDLTQDQINVKTPETKPK